MLTLKYRPQSIGDLVGQDDVKLALEKAFTNNKIASAYLLTGPRGAGKTSTARIIAKSLNCKNKKAGEKATLTPCGKCSSCINITNGGDLDVVEIDAASHGGVDDARDLVIKANLSTVNSDYKIYIIDEVHMASKDAFNALLKLFEEPPENVVFILATTEAHKVLPTIVSRCQQFRFKPINQIDCFKRLRNICDIEQINISDEALKFITEESEGALRDALSILEQVSVFNEEDLSISKEIIERTLGKVSEREVFSLFFSIINKETLELLNKIETIFLKNPDPQILTGELFQSSIKILEELCLNEGLEECKTCIDLINEKNIPKAEILYIAEEISKYETILKQSSQAKKLFKTLCLKLSLREDFIDIKNLRERVLDLENRFAGGAVKPLGVTVSASSKNQDLTKSSSNFENRPSAEEVFKPTYTNTKNEFSANNLVSSEAKVAENIENSEKINAKPFSEMGETVQNGSPAENANSNSTLETASSFGVSENTVSPDSSDFMQFLNPPTKGLINSSKAKLISSTGDKAVFAIPEKFKFLKTKLEAKGEELIRALQQALNPEIKFIEIQIDSGMASANSEINDSVKVKPAMTSALMPARLAEKVTDKEALLSVSEKAYSEPLADLENDSPVIAPASINIPNNTDMNLNVNSVNASMVKDSKNSNDNCCDREAYLDEVLQAGISIFGGNVVRE
ncbi:MAG: DNA polymerase III subunit gamma/tau [Candidatus Melainabacteria bacterium]|nr:DNA polymerase III subunit gamma/tau [Candidatus Melainabacteria bacterium]